MLRANTAVTQQPGLVMTLLLLLTPVAAMALDTDRSQPIQIEADRATLNEKDSMSIYEGNVKLRQGTLRLQGDQMTVTLANKQVNKIFLMGKPATLQQKQDGSDSDQHAEADNIEYSASNDHVILLGNARIWQAGGEEFRSERIVFSLKDNTVNAGSNNSQDRVHITIQPKNTPDNKH